jgi:hypothetical protein
MLRPGDILFSNANKDGMTEGTQKAMALVISIDRGEVGAPGTGKRGRPAGALLLFNNFELVTRDFGWITRNLKSVP